MYPDIRLELDDPTMMAGVLFASHVRVRPSDPELVAIIERGIDGFGGIPEQTRKAIRAMLRRGGFKPSGRSKPASEYLARTVERGELPFINNLVDVNNHVSLVTGWPASILDLDRALGGAPALELRLGRPGESYVFNQSGQVMDLAGLVCIARAGGEPVGNPVKDSMEAKTTDQTSRVVAVVYSSLEVADRAAMAEALELYGSLLGAHCDATDVQTLILTNDQPE